MSDPCWQPVAYLLPASFTYTTVQNVTFSGGAGQIMCPQLLQNGVPSYVEVQLTTGGYGVAATAIGICSPTYNGANIRSVISTAPATGNNFACVDESGDIFINGSYSGDSFPGVVTSATYVRIYWDGAGNVAFAQRAAPTPYWNGNVSLTDTTILTTGKLATGLTDAVVFVSPDGSPSQTWTIAASSANCVGALLSGVSYLAANASLQIVSITSLTGGTTSITWTAANAALSAGGIDAVLDGGSPVACGGTTTGTSGTATIVGAGSDGFHTLGIIENGLPLDESVVEDYYSGTTPSGAGTIVCQFSITATSNAATTLTLNGGPYDRIYLSAGYEVITAGIGVGIGQITVETATGDNEVVIEFAPTVTPSDTVTVSCEPSAAAPTTGPGTVTITGLYGQLDGFFDGSAVTGGEVSGSATATIGGTLSTWVPVEWEQTAPENIFAKVVIEPEATFGTILIGAVIWTVSAGAENVGYSGFVG